MKKYTGYLIFLNCIFLIQSCYTNLPIKEIDQELTNPKSKELELQRIKTEKEDIEKELFNFIGKPMEEKYSSYGILGDKLYLAVERDYDDCIQTIFDKVIFKYNDFTLDLSVYMIYKSVNDGKLDIVCGKLQSFMTKEKFHKCVAMSWLEAIKRDDEKTLKVLITSFETTLRATDILDAFLEMLVTLANDEESLKYFNYFYQHNPIPIESLLKIKKRLIYGPNLPKLENIITNCIGCRLLSYAAPIPCPTYKFSSSKKNNHSSSEEETGYSDSEDEDAPHFNGVYNLTKHGVYNIENETEYYNPIRNSENKLVNNYAKSYDEVSPWELCKDAKSIENCGNKAYNSLTILCVALRQHDGCIKRFVLTNLASVYQDSRVKGALSEIIPEAHNRGYHVIMAQQSHAESELMQFLQERSNRYSHIVAMGCSKKHCEFCAEMLEKIWGQGILNKISISEIDHEYTFPNWFIPEALNTFCQSTKCLPNVPEQICVKNKAWGEPLESGNYQEHRQLTRKEWKNRPWKREMTEKAGKGEEKLERKDKKRKESLTDVQEEEIQNKDASLVESSEMDKYSESSTKRTKTENESDTHEKYETVLLN